MKENLHDIDKLFKAALDDYNENPPEAIWDAIDKKLDKNKVIDINRKYLQVKRIAIALLILLFGVGLYTLNTFKTASEDANNSTNNNKQQLASNNITQSKIKQHKIAELNRMPENKTYIVNKGDSETVAIIQTQTGKISSAKGINEIKNQAENTHKKIVNIASKNKNELKQSSGNSEYAAFRKTYKQTTSNIFNSSSKRKISTNKGSQKSNITKGDLGDENIKSGLQNKGEITTWQRTVLPAIELQIIRPIFRSNSVVISGKNIFNKSSIKQSLLRQLKTKRNVPSIAATVFFAPNISSNNIKEENHEHRPGSRPDNDDRDRIREGEQHQNATTFGVLLDYNINQHWSLQSGVLLNSKTILIKPKTIYADKDDNGAVKYLYDCSSGYAFLSSKSVVNPTVGDSLQAFESTNKLQYLSIPLAMKYTWTIKKIDLFASIGTVVNILTKGQLETEIENGLSKQTTVSNKINGLKPAYWGGNISMGAAYNFNEKFALSFTPVFNFALASSTKGGIVKTYPNSIGLAAGIRYKL